MRPLDQALTIQTIAIGPPGRQGETGLRGQGGPRGLQGIQGLRGLPGAQVIAGEGPPSPSTGNVGDSYLDVLNFKIYANKDANAGWPATGIPYGVANPDHEWVGTALALYNADGTLGDAVDLQGAPGLDGGPIPAGGEPGQYPTPNGLGGYIWASIPVDLTARQIALAIAYTGAR